MNPKPTVNRYRGAGRVVGLAGIVLAICFCSGWADTWDGIRAAAERVESLSAEFVQAKHLPILTRPLVSRGVLYFRKPDSLRWEYRQPVRTILLMHKGDLRRYRQSGDCLLYTSDAADDYLTV